MAGQRKSNGSYTSTAAPSRPQSDSGRDVQAGAGVMARPTPTTAPTKRPEARGAETEATGTRAPHHEIERAAYFRWLRHGGDPATNWLAAEAELKGRAALKI